MTGIDFFFDNWLRSRVNVFTQKNYENFKFDVWRINLDGVIYSDDNNCLSYLLK